MYAQNNTFKTIKKNRGQDIICLVLSFEHLKIKYIKTLADIKFITSCKTDNIIPTFAKVKFSLKHSIYKSKLRIARLVMETEMQKNTLKRKTKEIYESYWNPT